MLANIAADDKCRRNFRIIFLLVLRVKAYLCCFTQFTVDQSKLTVNGSVLSDTPNVRYLVAYYRGRHQNHTYPDKFIFHHFSFCKCINFGGMAEYMIIYASKRRVPFGTYKI